MKRLLFALLFLSLSVPAYPWGGSMMVVGGGTPTAAGGSDPTVQTFETYTNTINSGAIYNANKITAAGSWAITRVEISGGKHASETCDMVLEIWSHDAGNDQPLALMASSDTIPNASLPTSTGNDWFGESISASITSGTTYWIVRKKTGTTSAFAFYTDVGNTSPERVMTSTDGSAWTLQEATRGWLFRLYGH